MKRFPIPNLPGEERSTSLGTAEKPVTRASLENYSDVKSSGRSSQHYSEAAETENGSVHSEWEDESLQHDGRDDSVSINFGIPHRYDPSYNSRSASQRARERTPPLPISRSTGRTRYDLQEYSSEEEGYLPSPATNPAYPRVPPSRGNQRERDEGDGDPENDCVIC